MFDRLSVVDDLDDRQSVATPIGPDETGYREWGNRLASSQKLPQSWSEVRTVA